MKKDFYFIAAALAATGLSATAQAHTKLVSATPAANSTAAKPTSLQLHFSGKLIPKLSHVDVFMVGVAGHAHAPMKVGAVATSFPADGKTIVVKLAQPLSAGTYRVDYQGVSSDTHKAQGSYSFNVK